MGLLKSALYKRNNLMSTALQAIASKNRAHASTKIEVNIVGWRYRLRAIYADRLSASSGTCASRRPAPLFSLHARAQRLAGISPWRPGSIASNLHGGCQCRHAR